MLKHLTGANVNATGAICICAMVIVFTLTALGNTFGTSRLVSFAIVNGIQTSVEPIALRFPGAPV